MKCLKKKTINSNKIKKGIITPILLNGNVFNKSFLTLEKVEYFKIFNFFIIIFVLSILLFSVAYFLSLSTIKDSEKLSQYECGFEPFDEATRHPFDVHFYIVGILFLIFDVEIALLFPWVIGLKISHWFGFFTMMLFLGILTVGFFYEWHRGALMWPHKKLKNK
jgi:NADH-quinone oxidoreductase subunit A